MRNHIQTLIIKGFKGFSEATEIGFSDLTVLAGANSVGKSSVVQAMLLSRATMQLSKDNKIPLNGHFLLALGKTNQITDAPNIIFDFHFHSGKTTLTYKVPIDRNYLELEELDSIGPNILNAPNFHYLNAERIGPRPLYEDVVQQLPSTGFQGEFAVQLYVDGLFIDINPEKNFHKVTRDEGSSLDNLTDQASLWMQFVIPGINNISANRLREVSRSVASYNQHTPPNEGFGISYVLPIVISGLIAEEGSLLIVENPEAHLHPLGQSRIGQFLAMVATSGTQVVVETHSEHVINGMRLASMLNFIQHSDILVNFLQRDEGSRKLTVTPIEVDKIGDLTDFPPGFFDQSAQDLIQLSQIRRRQNR